MKRLSLAVLCAALVATGLAPAASAGTLLVSDSVFKATKKEEKHPAEVVGGVLVPTRLTKADLCVFYSNTTAKGNQGQIRAVATILDRSGDPEKTEFLKLNGRVKNNEAIICKKSPTLRPGDAVTFEIRFEGMPRLRNSKKRTELAQIAGLVSQGLTLEDLIPEPPPPEVIEVEVPVPQPCPDPPPGPSPSPNPSPAPNPAPSPNPSPAPSGSLSAADQRAADSLLGKTTKTQLWRFKGDNPKKWTVVGPKTRLGNGLGGLNPATAGYGGTIAAAVADYERKMGKMAPGSGLSSRDLKALEWYSKMNSAGGPTSIRRDSGGGFHGEFYRPGKGALHRGPLGSIAAAVDFFKGHGL